MVVASSPLARFVSLLQLPFLIGYRGGGRTLETTCSRPHTYVKLRLDGKPPPAGVLPQRDHCLCVNIIYFWYKARVDLETGKKIVIFYHRTISAVTEQFEGAGARRQPSGKQAIVGSPCQRQHGWHGCKCRTCYERIPEITEELLPQMSPRGHLSVAAKPNANVYPTIGP